MPSVDFDGKISLATFVFELEDDRERPPFDASEFDSLFEDEDFNSPEHKELFRSHWTQVGLSQGFDLELDKPLSMIGGIMPIPKKDNTSYDEAEKLARLAVGINNCKPVSKKLEFVEVQKLNMAHCSGYSYYITFLAKDCSSGRLMVYQTKIHDLICGKIIVRVFREKPKVSALLKPGEVSFMDSSALEKDYDYLISNKNLVFEVGTDYDETSSDESVDDCDKTSPDVSKDDECEETSPDESKDGVLDDDDVFNSPEHKVLDLELDKPLAVMSGMEAYPSREERLDLYEKAEKLARLAVGSNNCRPRRRTLEFVAIQKLNHVSCSGFTYFITFLAKDCIFGRLMVYETKIQDLTSGTIKVEIFRERRKHHHLYLFNIVNNLMCHFFLDLSKFSIATTRI